VIITANATSGFNAVKIHRLRMPNNAIATVNETFGVFVTAGLFNGHPPGDIVQIGRVKIGFPEVIKNDALFSTGARV